MTEPTNPSFSPAPDGKVYVRREGRRCTIFVDNGAVMPLASFSDQPMDFPQTLTEMEVRGLFPGREFVFVEEQRAPQPESVDAYTPEQMAAKLAAIRKEAPTQGGPPPLPSQAPQPAKVITLPHSAASELKDRLLTAFKEEVLSVRAGASDAFHLENLGTFLINTFPELEADLVAAAQPPAKKRFTFGG